MELTTQQVVQEVVRTFYPLLVVLVVAIGLLLITRNKK